MTAPDDDDELLRRAASGDASAREACLIRHMGLVRHVVRRFRGLARDDEDLIQAGALALLQAIDRFDPSRGVRFSTYAVPLILGEVRSCLERTQAGAHVGRRARRRLATARATRARLAQELEREPSIREVARAMDADAADLAQLLDADGWALLDTGQDGDRPDDDGPAPVTVSVPSFENDWIDAAAVRQSLASLPERQRRLLALRFLAGLSQAEAGRRLGLSQAQISRLERRALDRLRDALAP